MEQDLAIQLQNDVVKIVCFLQFWNDGSNLKRE